MTSMLQHWDIFCRVVDNFGDAGVCWRLARQLATEFGKGVRLWIDDIRALAQLEPTIAPECAHQRLCGVEVRLWEAAFPEVEVADVVIEAFACELPENYLRAMSCKAPTPCWINLEYLTAELWAEDWHGLASPHPSLPLRKYFFFPGYSEQSGGLLREPFATKHLGMPPITQISTGTKNLSVSLFCYETAPVSPLVEVLSKHAEPVNLLVAQGKPLAAIRALMPGEPPWATGNLSISAFEFLPQDGYDALLRRCAINFVRGEDSLIRALWAGRPFIWQAYLQEQDAHLEKLEAFLDWYLDVPTNQETKTVIAEAFRAWNKGSLNPAPLQAFFACREAIEAHHYARLSKLLLQTDLATRLVNFCQSKGII